jgi:glutamate racemase
VSGTIPRGEQPIGVFDSGLGGLTVVREMLRRLPNERIVYVGDTAHVPYGGRALIEVQGFATEISRYLIEDAGCKAVVMACNISSAVAHDSVQARFPDVPVLGVIGPGARAAAALAEGDAIAVLATEGTVRSGAYERALSTLAPEAGAISAACPKFVPLVEAGLAESPAAHDACREYLETALAGGARVVILGCTHYPFLLPTLRRVAGPGVTFIDPAGETVRELACRLERDSLGAAPQRLPAHAHRFYATGDPAAFTGGAEAFLKDLINVETRGLTWDTRAGRLTIDATTAS